MLVPPERRPFEVPRIARGAWTPRARARRPAFRRVSHARRQEGSREFAAGGRSIVGRLREDLPVGLPGDVVGLAGRLDLGRADLLSFCDQHWSTALRHHSADFFEARIGLPSTTTKTGLVCDDG